MIQGGIMLFFVEVLIIETFYQAISMKQLRNQLKEVECLITKAEVLTLNKESWEKSAERFYGRTVEKEK